MRTYSQGIAGPAGKRLKGMKQVKSTKYILNIVELFSGSGTISKEFEEAGHKTFSIDIRKRKGVCEPDLRKNILELTSQDIPFKRVDVVWASPPCNVWSYASSGAFHWNKDQTPRTEKCQEHTKILKKCLDVIKELNPMLFFIENPRGRLRKYPALLEFLKENHGVIKSLTLSSYGFETTKPTNIFTNALDYAPKELDRYGRGAKVEHNLDNLTRCQRQKTPRALAQEIRKYCEDKLEIHKRFEANIRTIQ